MANALARGNVRRQRRAACRRAAIVPKRWSSRRGSCSIHGVDLVNMPDGPRATGRMSALAAAVMVQQQAGIETILHYACRDRNMIGMQSDLLGAHAMGMRNLLVDHRRSAARWRLSRRDGGLRGRRDRPDQPRGAVEPRPATSAVSRSARRRRFTSASPPIPARSTSSRSCGASPTRSTRVPSSRSRSRCSTSRRCARFLARIGDRAAAAEGTRIPVLAAMTPLESVRHAEFMANEVPGVSVPPAILERMRAAEEVGSRAR